MIDFSPRFFEHSLMSFYFVSYFTGTRPFDWYRHPYAESKQSEWNYSAVLCEFERLRYEAVIVIG
jgi:hypothetical protein